MRLTNLILSNDDPNLMRILILSGVAWVPLALLTLIDGTFVATDVTIPFIKDVVPYVRSLFVIPLLVMADNIIEPAMARALDYLRVSGVVPDLENERLEAAAQSMSLAMNSKVAQLVLLVLVVSISWLFHTDYVLMWSEHGATSWALHMNDGEVDVSLAGLWFLLVSSPLVSFLLYRWIWRFIIWSVFLYRVSRLKLDLYASHSDMAGGLGIIGQTQLLFGVVFLVMTILISSDLANNLLYEGEKLANIKLGVVGFIAISVIILTAPLLCFSEMLYNLKRKALAEYSRLQQQISGDFHKKWIIDMEKKLVDSMQPSAMADYNVVYEVVSNMRIIPISLASVVILAVVLLLPFLPLALTESSIVELLRDIGRSLL